MDAFEKARIKAEKMKERRDAYFARKVEEAVEAKIEEIAPVKVEVAPKEKVERGADAVFDVRVYLPDADISFTLTKPNVYANVPRARMTQAELKKAIANGLSGLMGGVK